MSQYNFGIVARAVAVGAVAVGSKAAMLAKSAGGLKGVLALAAAGGAAAAAASSANQNATEQPSQQQK
ncbi:hypothetical protein WJX73_006092 [Symbiochloris irregularis]|uniref:Uncharacterized protein n=1 Tax=Symbiochloris irregularis TaxID=706552 RepID=A0AAW1NV92_9CHLO